MTVKESILKIIALAVCGAVLIISMVAFKIDTYAAETETVILSGEDLQALLMSGEWQAFYTASGMEYEATNVGATLVNGCVVLISDIQASGFAFTGGRMLFGSQVEYSDVVSFEVVTGAVMSYVVTNPGSPVYGVYNNSSSNGTLLGSTSVSLPSVTPNASNGTVDITIETNNSTHTLPFSKLSSTFEPMRLNEFIITHNFSINLQPSQYATPALCNVKTAVKEIKITFNSSSSGGSGDSSGGGSQALIEQLEKANEYLEEITNSSADDDLRIDDIEKEFNEVQDKADEYNEAMDSVETPEPEEVIPQDSVAEIYEDENITEGQPYIFSILESLQSITWILTMILISVVVGIIKYIIYGKS